jgi:DNA-binding transcriptional ArsR family regulator
MSSLLERHGDKIRGVMSCFDRVVIHGTLPGICSADGMTSYLHRHAIRIFDYPHFAQGLRGEHTISGIRNRHIRRLIPELSAAQVSRHLKSLRTHGLIKRVGRTYKYYLTKAGRTVALAGLKLRSLVLVPELATMPSS